MTNEEAIKVLTNHRRFVFEDSEEDIAIVMALRSLKNEQTDGDLISRQAVIDGINTYINKAQSTGSIDDFISFEELVVKALPSVKLLKNEQTDGDLISRKEVEKCCLDGWNKDYKDILEDIRKLPSSEKTAEWIKQKSGDELFPEEIVCSKCYHSNSHLDFDEHNNPIGKVFLESKYCPNCGAKMKGGN